jgi:hypothetical protein
MCVCKRQPHNDTVVRKQATKQGEAEGCVQISGQALATTADKDSYNKSACTEVVHASIAVATIAAAILDNRTSS